MNGIRVHAVANHRCVPPKWIDSDIHEAWWYCDKCDRTWGYTRAGWKPLGNSSRKWRKARKRQLQARCDNGEVQ